MVFGPLLLAWLFIPLMLIAGNAITLYRRLAGAWQNDGGFTLACSCPGLLEGLRHGDYKLTADPHPWNVTEVAGLRMVPRAQGEMLPDCPKGAD